MKLHSYQLNISSCRRQSEYLPQHASFALHTQFIQETNGLNLQEKKRKEEKRKKKSVKRSLLCFSFREHL